MALGPETGLRGHKTQARGMDRCVGEGSGELGVPPLGAVEDTLASPVWIWQWLWGWQCWTLAHWALSPPAKMSPRRRR